MARRCFSVGREMMAELHERWRHMYRNRSVPAAAVVAKPLEDREWSPEPLIRKLIQQQLQQMPLPMSPVSRYYLLRKDIEKVMAAKPRDLQWFRKKEEALRRVRRAKLTAAAQAAKQRWEAICLLLNSMAWSSIEHVPELCARYAKQLPPPEGAKGRGRRRAAAPKARPVARSYTYSLGEFQVLLKEEREKYARDKKYGILRKQRQKRNHGFLNRSIQEEEEVYEAEEEAFGDEWREKSILEDLWKAETYRNTYQKLRQELPEREPLAQRKDRIADVMRSAVAAEYLDMERPVLTHELADYENPYMMKRSAMERLLQERCVRNQLDERMLPRLLDAHPDLVKLRRQAQLPPEALEPLSAFRGDVRWSFDSRERLQQKLEGVQGAIEALKKSPDVAELLEALPEKQTRAHPSGLHHPWRNHLGFESFVPRGVAGGTKFGQPEEQLATELQQLRYPTLQRVAHTLPKDLKWRAHVVRSIRVLERNRHWDFKSKLDAINRMKEIYDYLKPSDEYTRGLDEKMPVNRVASKIKRKYAPEADYVRTTHRNWYREKSYFRYRPSLTATRPLGKAKKS